MGRLIGVAIAAAAVLCVFLIDWKKEVPQEPPAVRPVKTMLVGSPITVSGRKYPGRVRANQEVNLAFQVAGPLIEFPVKKGQLVEEGDLLARIDPRDFGSRLQAKQAALDKAEFDLDKIERLAKTGTASPDELTHARAVFDTAEAEVQIAAKALEDTYLRAPFGGVIANTFVDNFENVQGKQPILSLQDVSSVTIEVSVPEERVVRGKGDAAQTRFVATFDYLPGREFEVTLKEFSTEADPATQTYTATFVMPAPQDVTILPGMTATIQEYRQVPEVTGQGAYALPVEAVPVDGLGSYYVWVVREDADGTTRVHRANVKVGEMIQNDILVIEGLSQGDRIATAGVHLLQEGQQVRLLEPGGEEGSK